MKIRINDSVVTCDEITNAVAKLYIVTPETVSIYFSDKSATYEIDYYILHTFLLVNIFISVITCYYFTENTSNNIKYI